jgi:RimJ/RimL family protein N-acetyltransferase
LRNQGYGTKIIYDLIHNASEIIPYSNNIFDAEIDIDAYVSIQVFKKIGFP